MCIERYVFTHYIYIYIYIYGSRRKIGPGQPPQPPGMPKGMPAAKAALMSTPAASFEKCAHFDPKMRNRFVVVLKM